MNLHLKNLAAKAARNIDLAYQGDAYPQELTRLIVSDLVDEFGKLRWAGEDDSWDRAIRAVQQEIRRRYG